MTIRTGLEARLEGEFAPATVTWPPGNVLCRIVLPEVLDFASRTFPASVGVSRKYVESEEENGQQQG